MPLIEAARLFSAYAEVFPFSLTQRSGTHNFSLPTQRCFLDDGECGSQGRLFSAYAEVFLLAVAYKGTTAAFLCLRRGVSLEAQSRRRETVLFSAYAEVFLLRDCPGLRRASFLCLRRGVSDPVPLFRGRRLLFSAYAEVFLSVSAWEIEDSTFLCLRRGVSTVRVDAAQSFTFSLPTQRCFPSLGCSALCAGLFSAYAEVFPIRFFGLATFLSFLCLRRGVSHRNDLSFVLCCFSLPTQRCFLQKTVDHDGVLLFSAYAEVFLIR